MELVPETVELNGTELEDSWLLRAKLVSRDVSTEEPGTPDEDDGC